MGPPPLGLGPARDPKNMGIGVTSVKFRVRVRVRVRGLVLGPLGP